MYINTSNQEKMDLGFGNYTCNWGLHVAGLYETEEERDQLIFEYLKTGFLNKESLLYIPTERSEPDFREKFAKHCPDCTKLLDSEKLSLYSARQLYYPNGVFTPWDMEESLNLFFEEKQKSGKEYVRAIAEMVWTLDVIPGIENLMVYESRLNYFVKNKPLASLCLYNLSKFNGATIMEVLRTHPYTISKGIFTQNPYYQEPDVWLKTNAPEFSGK